MEANAVKLLKREGVQVKLYSIVYELIDQVRDAMLGLLEPETRETIIGHAKVLQVFKLNKGRAAGCMVEDGKILRSCEARVIRDKTPVFDGKMSTLRRFQDEVEEVKAGLECGIRLGDFNEYETGDIIECYTLEKIPANAVTLNKNHPTGTELLARSSGRPGNLRPCPFPYSSFSD